MRIQEYLLNVSIKKLATKNKPKWKKKLQLREINTSISVWKITLKNCKNFKKVVYNKFSRIIKHQAM